MHKHVGMVIATTDSKSHCTRPLTYLLTCLLTYLLTHIHTPPVSDSHCPSAAYLHEVAGAHELHARAQERVPIPRTVEG